MEIERIEVAILTDRATPSVAWLPKGNDSEFPSEDELQEMAVQASTGMIGHRLMLQITVSYSTPGQPVQQRYRRGSFELLRTNGMRGLLAEVIVACMESTQ